MQVLSQLLIDSRSACTTEKRCEEESLYGEFRNLPFSISRIFRELLLIFLVLTVRVERQGMQGCQLFRWSRLSAWQSLSIWIILSIRSSR